MSRAIVYVRVSSADQVQGFSLEVQERVCRDFAERQGWTVDSVAREEGESAKTADRRQLQKVLARLRKPDHGFSFFLVYDLTRFTRSTADYFALKAALEACGVRLVSVTQPIEETPSGRFMGTVLAAQGQFDNELRAEKVIAGMKAAIERGIWPWGVPRGYLSVRTMGKRSTLVHDPAVAPLIARIFERLAAGLVTQEEARVEFARAGIDLPRESFRRLVHNPIYCGRIVAPEWKIEGRAAFRPIVSEELFDQAQRALAGKTSGWKRSDLRPDFPLRWWTRCLTCRRPLTGSYSQGKCKRYPYYHCPGGCMNVARDHVHEDFATLLDSMACPPGLWRLWDAILREAWQRRSDAQRHQADASRRRLRALDAREEKVVSALLDGDLDAPTVRRMRAKIATERGEAREAEPRPLPDLEHSLRIGRRIVESPRAAWDALAPSVRPGFLRTAFPSRLDYDRISGFGTPDKSLFINALTGASGSDCGVKWARRDGASTPDPLEILTGWEALAPFVEDQCSTPP